MTDHVCSPLEICICYADAEVPNDKCPVHGLPNGPLKCGVCGRFITTKSKEQLEQEALAPLIHQYRLGIETLIFAWMAETGHGLKDFEIKTRTEATPKGNVFETWIEPKVRI